MTHVAWLRTRFSPRYDYEVRDKHKIVYAAGIYDNDSVTPDSPVYYVYGSPQFVDEMLKAKLEQLYNDGY